MKKFALALCTLTLLGGTAVAAPFEDGFEGDFPGATWTRTNLSSSAGSNPNWDAYGSDAIVAHGGNQYVMADYNSVGAGGARTISNWLISPELPVVDGITMTFWSLSAGGGAFADRMQVRLSTMGASVDVGADAESVGAFTTLLLDVNPALVADGYPSVWTQYTVTVEGVPAATTGRFAFRYYVADSGPGGTNGAAVALDDVEITSTCGDGSLDAGAGEACDDGNAVDGDGCETDCTVTPAEPDPVCGDGALDEAAGETCDDGNVDDGDGCSATCDVEPSDLDNDGFPDDEDNCPVRPNADQADGDDDGLGDACDSDSGGGGRGGGGGGCAVVVESDRGAPGAVFLMIGLVGLDVLRRRRRARRQA